MGENSKIEWTHHTMNPWRGCTKVSAGCDLCYAEKTSLRNPKVLGIWGDEGTRVIASDAYWREPLRWNRDAEQAGERRRVFCASLADVCEDRRELDAPRARLAALIDETPWLLWLLLSKRPQNYTKLFSPETLRKCGIGTSTEDQPAADERIPHVLTTPAAFRFISAEPLLGPIWLTALPVPDEHAGKYAGHGFTFNALQREDDITLFNAPSHLDLVIAGGESGGPNARPMHPDWPRYLRNQCVAAGVAYFHKQNGEWYPVTPLYEGRDDSAEDGTGELEMVDTRGHIWSERDGQPNDPRTWLMERVGKKAAGRLLDGIEWNQMPAGLTTQSR